MDIKVGDTNVLQNVSYLMYYIITPDNKMNKSMSQDKGDNLIVVMDYDII